MIGRDNSNIYLAINRMRNEKGQLLKGTVLNPTGKPKGSGSRQTFFREKVAPHQDMLIRKAMELAENGSEGMLKFLLERMIPTKYQKEALEIRGTTPQHTIDNIITHLETGEVTPDEASKIASIIHKDAEIDNQQIMIQKLSALEAKMDNNANVDIDTKSDKDIGENEKMDTGRD